MQFIKQYPKAVPDDLCDHFIKVFEENEENQFKGMSGLDYGRVDLAAKDSTDLDLMKGTEIYGWNKESKDRLEHCLMVVLADYMSYTHPDGSGNRTTWTPSRLRQKLFMLQGPRLMRYHPGQGFYAWHTDGNTQNGRQIVMMAYLNDVAEGGETAFLHQGVKVRPEKGKIAIFPASFTHYHCGMEVISNTKYAINFNFGNR